ncbi:TIGR03087 family PEP-CTERM/XrtA system glycosyltransferase [Methylothermus subterraneus]|nr:glycosyl transferase family 1 [uncultured Gammaproteobacteria bacterium]
MANLLYLSHRIPYPPNKGDKIRSFRFLKHFAQRHRVFLGTFVDFLSDLEHAQALADYTQERLILPLPRRAFAYRGLAGLVRGRPLTQALYADPRLYAWCRRLVEAGKIDAVFVFSSAMAQFVNPSWRFPKILDFVDVDSDKWRQYAAKKPFWSRWLYSREAAKLLEYDRKVARAFDLCLFVSPKEAALFKQLVPEAANVDFVENGVDTDYFRPGREFPSPYRPGEQVLVFTGAMDYWANVDAVRWFADRVFPKVLQYHVEARFYIVGARPSAEVKLLGRREGVVVTGQVPDVRPYLAHARLAVAPLRIARGIQNKILEALAMGKSVLATSMAMDGLEVQSRLDLGVADAPGQMADLIIQALRERDFLPFYSATNRSFVEMRYSWNKHLERLDAVLAL